MSGRRATEIGPLLPMKTIHATMNFAGTVIEMTLRASDEFLKDEHTLRQLKNLLETNGRVLNLEFDVTEQAQCENCAKFAELFAQAATCATEAGAVVRSLLRTLNDLEITRQVEAAEKLLAEVQPVNKYLN